MIGNTSVLSSFQPSFTPHVTLANGSFVSIVGSGAVKVISNISLSNVASFQIPCNLLSVSQITRVYNCGVFFFPDYCVFQDLLMKIFVRRYKSGGLYIIDGKDFQLIATIATLTPS